MKRIAGAIVAIAVLGLAGTAQAGVVTADGSPLSVAANHSISAAERTFPEAARRCPTVTVLFTTDSRGVEGAWRGWASPTTCEVGLRPELPALGVRLLCPVIVHEWGHLAGLNHSDDPGDVMGPSSAWPPACGDLDQMARDVFRDEGIYGWFATLGRRSSERRLACRQHFRRGTMRAQCRRRARAQLARRKRRLGREWSGIARRLRATGEPTLRDKPLPYR